MAGTLTERFSGHKPNPGAVLSLALVSLAWSVAAIPSGSEALGESTRLDVRRVTYRGGNDDPRPTAPRRIAWEVRKRTSIETLLTPTSAGLDDPTIFETPLLYWTGDATFEELSEAETSGLRRFVEFGGFILIDDATGGAERGFDSSIRRALRRALPTHPLAPLDAAHTVYRSFYLLNRPVGRVSGRSTLEAITIDDRVAVLYSRHDLGGAWARDNLGTWEHEVTPGGDRQRELAIRLGVNIVMYALCLDYKDDQVHAPFIMRRRGGGLP